MNFYITNDTLIGKARENIENNLSIEIGKQYQLYSGKCDNL